MPRAVYVHLPFCSQHCTYCPFAISTDLALQDAYVEALLREIDGVARASGAPLGGGRARGARYSTRFAFVARWKYATASNAVPSGTMR